MEFVHEVEILYVNTKAKVSLPLINLSIYHHEQFTTKRKSQSRDELLVWVREEEWKLWLTVVFGKSTNDGNDINVCYNDIRIYEVPITSTKSCPSVRYLLQWNVNVCFVWEVICWLSRIGALELVEEHKYEMTKVIKGHKIVRRLNPNDNKLLCEVTNSMVPPRHILTTLRNKNDRNSTTKHIYNVHHKYR